ncbi:hypothetical protein RN001_014582 [Aquatica leii]|uniref:G-protein coupled receptors family 2 profile 2 domain-containing protein n=1 Tax=Aquatica leii TaxID=1421715 RepID=A0AAN7QBS4_9COLE|nr:hypothetical protein RN001_014582 [Aquatica leii]
MNFLSLGYLTLLLISCSDAYTCNAEFGIDISDGELIDNDVVIKNGILFTSKHYKKVNGVKTGCICDINVCVRKCCPLGQYMTNKTCVDTNKTFVIPEQKRPDLNGYQFIFGNDCKHKKRRTVLDPAWNSDQDFILTENGKIWVPAEKLLFKLQDYCVDYIEDFDEIRALVCDYKNANISDANVIGIIISMPFLLLTFIVYALLPERNLHRKSLMCYVITLFGAYLLLAIMQIYPNSVEFETCKVLALLCLFCFMVSFFFMNIMSIDMWWTFSGLRGFTGTRKQKEKKRLILYNAYAWGVPLILVILVTVLTHTESIPDEAWYNPGIGEGRCWFRSESANLLYFYGPIALIILTNMVLFCITALKIKKTHKETEMLTRHDSNKHTYERDKQRYYLFLKLMLAMGVNWSMEIISWLVNWQVAYVPQSVWYITDFCNALYGMFIFFIFVFKKNIWELLKQRFVSRNGKPLLTKSVIDGAESESIPKTQAINDSSIIMSDTKLDLELK